MSDTEEQPHRVKRTAIPSAHVTCAENAADLELPFHWKAQVATWPPEGDSTVNRLAPGAESDAEIPPKKKKGLQKDHIASQANGPACDGTLTTESDGLLKDIQVIDVDEPTKKGQAEHTQDIDAHFSAPYLSLNNRKVWDCNACSKQLNKHIAIIDQTTTL
ncbi:hypothetical protein JVU11DRAFT_3175 [Chiua virens]|nr:hypothetical protein JVU11DRAFT_3175 [Chiua virens]